MNIQGKVIFCGVRQDIGAILSSFDIFVLPSFIEGLSKALLEAMSSGRAIICSDIHGNRELIRNNIEGLLVDPNDSTLASNIQLLSRDESLRRRLGNNAKYRASEYSEEMVFPRILDDYLRLTKNNSAFFYIIYPNISLAQVTEVELLKSFLELNFLILRGGYYNIESESKKLD